MGSGSSWEPGPPAAPLPPSSSGPSNHVRFSMNPKGSQVYGHYGTRQRTVLDYPSLGLGDFRVRTFEGGFTPTGNGEEGFAVAVGQQADPDRYQLLSFSPFVGRMEYHGFR